MLRVLRGQANAHRKARPCSPQPNGKAKWCSFLQHGWPVSSKMKPTLTIRSPHHTPWYLTKEVKTSVHPKIRTQIFIATLHIVDKCWKQPRRSSPGEYVNKLWSTQTMKYYSVLKRNKLSSYKKTRETEMLITKPKGYILCDSNYMAFWTRQNYGDS